MNDCDLYYVNAHVTELAGMARQIHLGRKARAAKVAPASVAPLEAATIAHVPARHENPFHVAQANRVA